MSFLSGGDTDKRGNYYENKFVNEKKLNYTEKYNVTWRH